jgi:isoleucyl-tRNA synthetase
VLGDFANPYKTMDFKNEAGEIRALAEIVKAGFVFKGLKPVNWCFRLRLGPGRSGSRVSRTRSPRPSTSRSRSPTTPSWPRPLVWQALSQAGFAIVIWTTTPWTIPANQALNVHPEFNYALVDVGDKPAGAGRGTGRGVPGSLRVGRVGHRHDHGLPRWS